MLPRTSHLQNAVLIALQESCLAESGEAIRTKLAKRGIESAGPAFYQMMARLEEAALVKGNYRAKQVGGKRVKERVYRITKAGTQALAEVMEFYLPSQ